MSDKSKNPYRADNKGKEEGAGNLHLAVNDYLYD
jgi:hypothetical protein